MSAPSPSLFDLAAFKASLGATACRFNLEALAACASTNTWLLRAAQSGAASGTVVVADTQTAGRGRMGRSWISSPGNSLTFSLLWRFPAPSPAPQGLSLAVGVALVRGLQRVGVDGVRLKWPNDLLLSDRKLGGILVELQPGDVRSAVIGIGINLRLPAAAVEGIEPASLEETGVAISREALTATLLEALCATLDDYGLAGFPAVRQAWERANAHAGKQVQILGPGIVLEGQCRGVDADGALLLETDRGVERIISGDVSLRPAA